MFSIFNFATLPVSASTFLRQAAPRHIRAIMVAAVSALTKLKQSVTFNLFCFFVEKSENRKSVIEPEILSEV